jgi:hypothetical protein
MFNRLFSDQHADWHGCHYLIHLIKLILMFPAVILRGCLLFEHCDFNLHAREVGEFAQYRFNTNPFSELVKR